jgi:NADH-quinone oxidoreductase subunit A
MPPGRRRVAVPARCARRRGAGEVGVVFFDLANILVFVALTIVFVGGMLLVGRVIRPRIPEIAKDDPYECGEKPVGSAWIQFNFRFYLVALVFIIFEVEIAFMFPVVAVYRQWVESGRGAVALLEVLFFVLVLFVGLVYVWSKGDLRWFKAIERSRRT